MTSAGLAFPHQPTRRTAMPLIAIQYSSGISRPSLKAEIAAAASELSSGILHKDPKVTAVIVQDVDGADWFAGGRSLKEQKLARGWVDIHITQGHNTTEEKGGFIRAAA